MKKTRLNLALAAIAMASASISFNAFAGPITVNGGWVEFSFGAVGSGFGFSNEPYTFTLSKAGTLTVTDAFLSGDRFEIFDLLLGSLGLTSNPTTQDDQIFDDYDAAAADPRWSTGVFSLAAGNYSITGMATASPYNGGNAALRVDTVPEPASLLRVDTVPEPASLALLGIGLAGLVAIRRRNKA